MSENNIEKTKVGEIYLSVLREHLINGKNGILLQGPEGFGKRELVKKCINDLKGSFSKVVWVDSWGIDSSLTHRWEFYLEQMIVPLEIWGKPIKELSRAVIEKSVESGTLFVLAGVEKLNPEEKEHLWSFVSDFLKKAGFRKPSAKNAILLISSGKEKIQDNLTGLIDVISFLPLRDMEGQALLKQYNNNILWGEGKLDPHEVSKALEGNPLLLYIFAQIADLEIARQCLETVGLDRAADRPFEEIAVSVVKSALIFLRRESPRVFIFLHRLACTSSPLDINTIAEVNFATDALEGKIRKAEKIEESRAYTPVPESYIKETQIILERLCESGLVREENDRYGLIHLVHKAYQTSGENKKESYLYLRDFVGASLVRSAWHLKDENNYRRIGAMADELFIIVVRALEEGKLRGASGMLVPLAHIISATGRRLTCTLLLNRALDLLRKDTSQEVRLIRNLLILTLAEHLIIGSEWKDAQTLYEEALLLARESGDVEKIATILHQMGIVYENLGDFNTALECCRESQSFCHEIGNRQGEAASLHQMAVILTNKKEVEESFKCYEASLAIKREIGDRRGEAATLTQLGQLNVQHGNPFKGLNQIRDGYKIFVELKDPRANQVAKVLSIAGLKASLRFRVAGQYNKEKNKKA